MVLDVAVEADADSGPRTTAAKVAVTAAVAGLAVMLTGYAAVPAAVLRCAVAVCSFLCICG